MDELEPPVRSKASCFVSATSRLCSSPSPEKEGTKYAARVCSNDNNRFATPKISPSLPPSKTQDLPPPCSLLPPPARIMLTPSEPEWHSHSPSPSSSPSS